MSMENCQGVHVATGSEARRGAWETSGLAAMVGT